MSASRTIHSEVKCTVNIRQMPYIYGTFDSTVYDARVSVYMCVNTDVYTLTQAHTQMNITHKRGIHEPLG